MPKHRAFIKVPPTINDKHEVTIELETKSSERFLTLTAAIQAFIKTYYSVNAEVVLEIGPAK